MSAPLRSSWELHQAAGQAPAVIRVDNLQATIEGPEDAWGRPQRPQPLLLSVWLGLDRPWLSTSEKDALGPDTVHYGRLSQTLLASVARLSADQAARAQPVTLAGVLSALWFDLTGLENDTATLPNEGNPTTKGFLDLSFVRFLELTARLPKASLVGDGISLSWAGHFSKSQESAPTLQSRGSILRLHRLRLPTLIGINKHERTARQTVMVSAEVDKLESVTDGYTQLEAAITEELARSSFDTLEALAARVATQMTAQLSAEQRLPADGTGAQLRVAVEKPMAVPFADAPCIELRINTNDILNRPRSQDKGEGRGPNEARMGR